MSETSSQASLPHALTDIRPLDTITHSAIIAHRAEERGIEATFQQEDSELSSEMLPDPEGRGKGAAGGKREGGAGALRRLVDDRDAPALAARTALEIMHFDPVTGEDLSRDEEERERCVLACYECLLSYGNQNVHGMVNRHLVRDWMLQLATASNEPTHESSDHGGDVPDPATPLAAVFVTWLRSGGYRLPDEVDTEVVPSRGQDPRSARQPGRTSATNR